MIDNELSARINAAGLCIERELGRRLARVQAGFAAKPRTFDELDRAIDEIADESLRERLQRLVFEVEEAGKAFRSDVDGVLSYDLLDPVRIVATDVRHRL
jgi:hypothetical protein